MKLSISLRLCFGLLLFFFVGVTARGGTLVLDLVSGYQSGAGGEFNVKSSDLGTPASMGYASQAIAPNGGFETFCLEYGEHFTPGSTYNFAISAGAVAGGPGAHNGSDPISQGTAWLYSQFAHGTLAGYDYTAGAGRMASAADLQNTIWWLENENYSNGTSPNPNNTFSNAVIAQFGSAAAAMADNTSYNVAVLNLGDAPAYANQDQLILHARVTPDAGATGALLGLALSGLAVLKRRFV